MPPVGGSSWSMVFNMVVAGVMGYPAKKRQPAAIAPRATASLPSMNDSAIWYPFS
jgi:hypothetical protein